MSARRTIRDVVIVQLPWRGPCPACTDGKLEDGRACPRCHGDGVEPFPPDPACGHKDCPCSTMQFVGYADQAEQEPVFECDQGRFTCARYTDPEQKTTTVAVEADGIGWAILELDGGKRRLGGYVSETVIAGVPCLRIEVPVGQGRTCTQIYNAGVLYCLTPTTEEIAKVIAAHPEASFSPAPLERGYAEPIPATAAGDTPIAGEGGTAS